MKKLTMIRPILYLLLPTLLWAQIMQQKPGDEKVKNEKSEGVDISKIMTPNLSVFESRLYDELAIAKSTGEEKRIREIESILARHYQPKHSIGRASKSREWVQVNDILLSEGEDETSWKPNDWYPDIFIAQANYNEKAVSLCSRSNGDLYAVYEDYGSNKVQLRIKKSTDGGHTWNLFQTLTGDQKDLWWPCAVIGEGQKNRLFISFYTSNQEIYIGTYDLDNPAWGFIMVQSSGDNIRPRICVDYDNYYYIYIVWIEEDWPSADDIYFSRSLDFGVSFTTPQSLGGGVHNNLDIGWGNQNLYIVYQSDSPGKINLIKSNSPYGGTTWSSPLLISSNENKHDYPRIAVSKYDNKACVVYKMDYSSTNADVRYSYTTNGTQWNINNSISSSTSPEMLADIFYMPYSTTGNNFHVAWYHDGYIKYRNSDDLSNWSSAQTISNNANNSLDDFVSVIANPANKGIVAWVYKYSSTDYDIHNDTDVPTTITTQNNNISTTNVQLYQNYPNPFNPETTIKFYNTKVEPVSISIYNTAGQKVRSLVNEEVMSIGEHEIKWDGKNEAGESLSSGVYFYKIITPTMTSGSKMSLIK